MATNESKKNFLEKFLLTDDESENGGFTEELHALLLSDTKNGKLYKYRSFDKKGWSLKSLKSQTLHCSPANAFNDPFDCKLGMDFNSLISDIYEDSFVFMERLIHKAISVINENKTLTDFGKDDQEIIKELVNCRFGNFYRKYKDQKFTDEEITKLILDDFEIVEDLTAIALKDNKYGERMLLSLKMMPQILEKMNEKDYVSAFDDNASFADFARNSGIEDDVDEMKMVSLVYQKFYPEDISIALDSEAKLIEVGHKLTSMLSDLFYIGCLCTDYKNRLMWSHYADSHRGFCIEYDYSSYGDKDSDILPFPVIYSKYRIKAPWKIAIENTPKNEKEAYQKIMLALLTKDSAWEYEKEWRVLISSDDSKELRSAPISCIYLGALCSEKNKKKIIKIARNLNVPVKQMTLDRGEFELHTLSVD